MCANLPRPLSHMHYVYVLKDKDSEASYIGYSNNLEQRIKQHKSTKNVELVYYEAYLLEDDARKRERKLKLYGSAWRGLKQRAGFNSQTHQKYKAGYDLRSLSDVSRLLIKKTLDK